MNLTKGKNILCIYYQFPPIKGIGTLRNMKFYASLREQARKVFVMTTSNRSFLPSDNYDIELENIIELATADFRTIHHKVFGSKGSLMKNESKSPIRSFVLDLVTNSPLRIFLGEGGMRFIRQGIKQGNRLIEEQGIDTIFSSYMPASTHIIARHLKKHHPQLTWIADYRDITPDPMRNNSQFSNFTTAAHKRILKYADEVLTVSQGLKERLSSYHDKVSVIRNGYEHNLLNEHIPRSNALFTLCYTGIFYPDMQKCDLIFMALQDLINEGSIDKRCIRFLHAGKDVSPWREVATRYNLNDIIVDKGLIPRDDALQLQRDADLNVLLTWSSEELKGIVTGKVFEYLAARRPVLTLVNGIVDEEIENIIEGTHSGRVFYHSEHQLPQMKSYILQQYNKWKYGENSLNDASYILPYSWENQFKRWNQPLRIIKNKQKNSGA